MIVTVREFRHKVTKVFKKAGIPMPYPYRRCKSDYERHKWIDLFWDWFLGDSESMTDFVKRTFGLDIYL